MGRSRNSRVEALTLKPGPTQSGAVQPPPQPPVGGEMLPVDKLSVFLSNYWILVVLVLLLPVAMVFYKKREMALKLLTPLLSRF
ncbi:MAG: hypothetical protein ABSG74_08520 [Candidatus Bathyarchaeia archaeon]